MMNVAVFAKVISSHKPAHSFAVASAPVSSPAFKGFDGDSWKPFNAVKMKKDL